MECAHDGCTCSVEGATYCSGHCENHAQGGGTGQPCECGHPECAGTVG